MNESYNESYNANNRTQFGSQQTNSETVVDSFTLMASPLLSPPGNTACSSTNASQFGSLLLIPHTYGPVHIERIHHIVGDTTSNIFGVAPRSFDPTHQFKKTDKTAIETLTKQGQLWSIYMNGQRGSFAVGSMAQQCTSKPLISVPLTTPSRFQSFVTSFYIVRLAGVYLLQNSTDGGVGQAVRITGSSVPKYVIFDTGTTNTYSNSGFGEELNRHGFQEGVHGLRLRLRGKNSDGIKKVADMDYSTNDLDVLNVFQHNALANFGSMFNGARVLLLGAHMMNRRYFEFDLQKKCLRLEQ